MPSSVFRCFKCISVYFGVYTDPAQSQTDNAPSVARQEEKKVSFQASSE